jgi:hypothetical protein
MSYQTVPLNALHKKDEFSCGQQQLDNYLLRQAKQDVQRMLSACFVLADEEHTVKGFYNTFSGCD